MGRIGIRTLIGLSCIFLIVSCSSTREQDIVGDFSRLPEYALQAKQANREEIISGTPWEFHRVGDCLFIMNGLPNVAAYVLRESDMKPMGNFVNRGNGPGECLSPMFAGHSISEDTVYLYDRTYHQISVFALPGQTTDTLSYSFAWGHRLKREKGKITFYGSATRLADGRFVAQRSIGTDSLFTIFDEKFNRLADFGEFPLPTGNGKEKDLREFLGIVASEGNTFYYATKEFAHMGSYTIHSDNSVTCNFAHTYVNPIYKIENDGTAKFAANNLFGFTDIKINRGYLWVLYNGNMLKDIIANQDEYAYPDTLILFSLDGIPQAKFKLPHKGNKFCFSREGKILYHFTKDFNIDIIQVDEVLDKL